MKSKIIGVFILLFLGILALESFRPLRVMKKNGAAPGYTGSPGDSLKNCTACHGGIAIPVMKWMRTNIPAEGYTPGQTYTITAINKVIGATRFGFEVSPQDSLGNLLGSMILTDTITTKFVGGTKYITYTDSGIGGIDSMKWSFDWMAPAKGTGDVTFYAAYNCNFDHNKTNDQTFIGTLLAKENLRVSVPSLQKGITGFMLYPNPANDLVNLSFEAKSNSLVSIDIIDISGKQVAVWMNEKHVGFVTKQFSTTSLPKGNYFVRVRVEGKAYTQKLFVTH